MEIESGTNRSRRGLIVGAILFGAALIVALFLGMQFAGQDEAVEPERTEHSPAPTAPEPTDAPDASDGGQVSVNPTGDLLPHSMSGQEAIDALGDDIEIAAERNGMTVDELTDLLLSSESARVSTQGHIFYVDPGPGD